MHKLKYKNHFYLLGYEYGVLIVLEIAAILESYGILTTYLVVAKPILLFRMFLKFDFI